MGRQVQPVGQHFEQPKIRIMKPPSKYLDLPAANLQAVPSVHLKLNYITDENRNHDRFKTSHISG
jgi:hypothetical protein